MLARQDLQARSVRQERLAARPDRLGKPGQPARQVGQALQVRQVTLQGRRVGPGQPGLLLQDRQVQRAKLLAQQVGRARQDR